MSEIEFHKWTKINQFHNVRKYANKLRSHMFSEGLEFNGSFIYRGKVKLDGTNAAVRMVNGPVGGEGVIAVQSRGRIITPEDDNYGFAKWVQDNDHIFKEHMLFLESQGIFEYDITTYGEWAGAGVQKRTSISKIDRRVFCIFAHRNHKVGSIAIDPSFLEILFSDHPDIFVLPWATSEINIDWTLEDGLKHNAAEINKLVIECEKCDPFVRDTFNVVGLGEGYVFYPIRPDEQTQVFDYDEYHDWMFKAKGDEHQTAKQTKPVVVDVEVLESSNKFVEKFVTLSRLEQGLNEVGGADMKNTGAFLKWFGNDVRSESADELAASNVEWKNVAKKISTKARLWWMDKCRE